MEKPPMDGRLVDVIRAELLSDLPGPFKERRINLLPYNYL